jgi:hypothetical protein
MKIRNLAGISLIALLVAAMSGCMGRLQSETIIIPDTETEVASAPANAPFEVKTIYRLPSVDTANNEGYVWVGPESLVVALWNKSPEQVLGRVGYPYDKLMKLPSPGPDISIDGFSPDGRYMAGFAREENGFQIKLLALSDGQEQVIDTITTSKFLLGSSVWSPNGRFVSYLLGDAEIKETRISVYDVNKKIGKSYTIPGSKEKMNLSSAILADDGKSALIVKETYEGWGFQLGTWQGSEFSSEYEHSLSADIQVAWINNDQISFVGTDGTLFLYDRRNKMISVLREQVVGFQLSSDRQYMAFSTNEDKIYVSKLQGNNLLNEKMVYQGVVSSRMSWSPDNGKLLVQGRKPYSRVSQAAEAAPAVISNSPFIIEFQ